MILYEMVANINVFRTTGDGIWFGDTDGTLIIGEKVQQPREW